MLQVKNEGLETKHILIVDDDPDTVQLLTTIYNGRGYQTIVAGNGQEALDWVEARKADIVVLDVMMPGMDGWETYRQIRVRTDIPVLFLSALKSAEHAPRALRLGADEYIQKPFHAEELLARTEALLRKTRRKPAGSNSERKTRPDQHTLSVSVVIPTLNEANNLPLVLPYLPMDGIDEVILVDGRSTDETIEVAKQLLPSIKVVLEPKPGKGAALRAGYEAASGDIIIVLDADGSHDPREIPRFIRALLEGADFARGSRFAPGGGTTDMPWIRKLGNGAFVKLVNLLFSGTFTDITFGYHAFWRYCLETIEYHDMDGFEFEIGLYIRALRHRMRIVDVPSFEGYRFTGVGKLQTIPDGWRILKMILREWIADLRQPHKEVFLGFQGNVRPQIWTPVLMQPDFIPSKSEESVQYARKYAQGQNQGSPLLLHSIIQELAEEFNLKDIQHSILQLTLEEMGASSGSIVVLDERGNVVTGCLVYGNVMQTSPTRRLADVIEQGLAGWVVRNRQPALVESTRRDPRWLRRPWEEHEGAERSALVIPLVTSDRVAGVLTLVRPEDEQFTHDDLALLAGANVR